MPLRTPEPKLPEDFESEMVLFEFELERNPCNLKYLDAIVAEERAKRIAQLRDREYVAASRAPRNPPPPTRRA